jgi:hypothetical protein
MDEIDKLAYESWEQVNRELYDQGGVNPTAFVLGFKYGYKAKSHGLTDWLLYGDTGASSLSMAKLLSKGYSIDEHYDHPCDSGDFVRCVGLLKAVPNFRKELTRMSYASKEWLNLIKHWDELEQWYLYDLEDAHNVLTRRIQEILEM